MDTTSKVGRPTKVSDDLARRIAALIVEGKTEADAAEESGIDRASFFDWMRRGRANEPAYMRFLQIVQAAKAKSRARIAVG